MKKYLLLLLSLFFSVYCISQDFSNKGKDFWVGYGYHQQMLSGGGGGSQNMVLYFATDQVTNITISVPGTGYTQSLTSGPLPTVLTSAPIPKTGLQDASLRAESTAPENKGIHVVSDRPIVAYAHIYNQSVSGATILFPTNTLGKEYYSVNYENVSNTDNSNCWFYVVACDTGTTTVEITPSAATINHPANVPFTITMTQGQVYNVLGQMTTTTGTPPNITFRGVDLTGSKIKSVSSGSSGCKRIAVFSGSGRISISCDGNQSSSDNYMVQNFPKNAWGKKYLTCHTGGNMTNNIYRICVADPATVVTVNGLPIASPLVNNFYYELAATAVQQKIESDLPILVAQYITSQNECTNANPGDPEVIYLSPVEQNISKVTWNATGNFNINQHYFNVVIPNTGTAISSFTLDGVAINPALFTVHPQDPAYSYLIQAVSGGVHTIQSDSGFNAIAYGFGNAESYGYNAGTNIRDLYNFLTPINPYSISLDPVACTGTPFYFSVTFPFQPSSLFWDFHGFPLSAPLANVTIANPLSILDATYFIGTRQVWRYKLPNTSMYTPAGTYPITITAGTTTSEGCGNSFERDFDLNVYDPPSADFYWQNNGCVTDTVRFRDTTTYAPGTYSYKWYWNFGDGFTDSVRYPKHKYAVAGTYTVKFAMISNVGCFSDTAVYQVTVTDVPVSDFSNSSPVCEQSPITFTNLSSAAPPGTLVKWYWDYGDGVLDTLPNGNNHTHTYATWGNKTITLKVETNSGCQGLTKTKVLYVNPLPFASFNLPGNVCLPFDSARFINNTTIADGTQAGLSYLWNFGDPPSAPNNTSALMNPAHLYSGTGPFNVNLTVTSAAGCVNDTTRVLNTVIARALAGFNVSPENCLNTVTSFTSTSTGSGNTITDWFWDFGDASTGTGANPTHTYATTGIKTIRHWVATNAGCLSDTIIKQVTIHPLPTASFNSNAPYCATRSISFTDASVANVGSISTWAWNFNDPSSGASNTSALQNPVHIFSSAGVYNVTLTVTNSEGCVSNVFTKTITINPLPFAGFTHLQACLPYQPVSFTNTSTVSNASTLSYQWNFGDPGSGALNISAALNPVHLYATAGTYNVNLVVTSSDGCVKDTTISISNIYAQPRGSFTVDAENCLNTPTVFTSTSTGSGATITNWNWDFGDGNTGTGANPSHTYATSGIKTIRHWVQTVNGCLSDTAVQTVLINPLPTGNFNYSTPSCQTRTISFTDLSVANAGSLVSWAWNFNDPASGTSNTSVLQNPVHEFALAGTYNVSLTVTSSKGCVSTQFIKQVIINDRPLAGFIVPEVCLNDTYAQFTDTSSIAAGSITSWQWNFGDGNATAGNPNTSTLQNPTHSYTAIGSYTAQLIVTSALGCKDTIAHTLFVNGSFPVADFSVANAANLCANDSVRISNTSTVFPGTITKVEIYWDNAGQPAVFETDQDPYPGKQYSHLYANFQAPLTKQYIIRFRAYSGGVCVNDKIQTITVNAAPKVQFNAIPNTCLNVTAFQITQATETGGVPGTFVFSGPGVSSTGMFNPVSVGPGVYNIKYTYTSNFGCVDSAIKQIRVLEPPVANFGFSIPSCETKLITFTDSSASAVGTLTTWTWNFGDGTAPVIRNSAAPFTHVFTNAGTYQVSLVVTTSDGCFSNVKQREVIIWPQPVASFRFTDTACIPNARISFTNTSSIANGTENSFVYLWNFGEPGSGTANTSTARNPVHTYSSVGPFTVNLRVTSGAGCIHDTSIVVNTIHPQPKAAFVFDKPSVCIGDDVVMNDQSDYKDGVANLWNWDFGDNQSSGLQNPSHTYGAIGLYNVTMYVVNSFGCHSDTVSKPFNVYPYPQVNAGPDRTVLEGESITLQPDVSGNDLQYLWLPNLYLSNNTVREPICKPGKDITYTLKVTARGGCASSDDVFVKVLMKPNIPNTFSPNNDGINDLWDIQYLDTYPNSRVQVFTRTGQLVFESRGYKVPWNGTFKGKSLPVDTYYYIIEPESGREPVTGYVTIVK